jgi:predicted phosphodiesterase
LFRALREAATKLVHFLWATSQSGRSSAPVPKPQALAQRVRRLRRQGFDMHIAVISDLHLGPGDVTDGFGHDDQTFLRFLRYLEANFERIVLLGDIWETLTGPRLGHAAASLAAARDAHPEIARRFAGPKYSYVHGNHDLVAGAADEVPDKLLLRTDGASVLFTHGHHHDLLIRKARWLSELGVWLGAWLLRLRLSPLYKLFNAVDMSRAAAAQGDTRGSFQRWAVGLARAHETDIVVTGHTHVPLRSEVGDRLFLNSGSCAEGRYSFAALDTHSGRYQVESSW